MNRWLAEEGLAIVRRWADEFLKDNRAVEDGEEAPATERKREVVRAGWTDDERLAHEIAESVLACGEDIVLRLDEVRADVGIALGKDLQRTSPKTSCARRWPTQACTRCRSVRTAGESG